MYLRIKSFLSNIIIRILISICIGLSIAYYVYKSIIGTWFTKDAHVSYDFFMNHGIQIVSKDNFFMNYGYWNSSNETLLDANQALIHLILEKSGLQETTHQSVLDVGCGYGEQEFAWSRKVDPSTRITAIDISETQIQAAKRKCAELGLSKRITFEVGDAMKLESQFKDVSFNTVLSVESAFHYADRNQFFRSVNGLLDTSGTFVICDIVLQEDFKAGLFNSLFLRVFSDFLHIPKANLLKPSEWDQSIQRAGFAIVECLDITDKTFYPYYQYFFNTYMKERGIPGILGSILFSLFTNVQPFSYRLAVCKKSG